MTELTATTTAGWAPPRAVARTPAPPRVLWPAVCTGLLAAVVVPAGPPGLGLVLLGVLVAVLLLRLAPGGVRGWRAVHGVLAVLLLASAALRDAPWLVGLDLMAAVAVGSLALTGGRTWAGLLRGLLAVGLAAPRGTGWLARGLAGARPDGAVVGPVARGLVLTALLLLVFGGLLASGDAVFASVLSRLVPDLPDVGMLPLRVVVGVLAAVGLASAALVLTASRPEPVVGEPARRLTRSAEWLLPLLALDLLLAAFVAVRSAVLFGGQDHVLETTGLTYAQHAREGFFQMVLVALLALAVVAGAVRWAPRSARPALGVLCVLALVVDASALHRLALYADELGLTRLRISTTAVSLWLGVVLVLVLVAGFRPGRWLPHAVVATAAAGMVVLTLADPDARIAASLVDRGAAADLSYLATLSADAVPELDRLPEPDRSCVLAGREVDGGPLSANLSRHRAAAVLAARPPGPTDCPLVYGW
jgi:hypothetical protein